MSDLMGSSNPRMVSDDIASSDTSVVAEANDSLPGGNRHQVVPESEGAPAEEKQPRPTWPVGGLLRKFGPWVRWTRYREFRRHDVEEPRSWRQRDQEENAKGRLPEDEHIQVPALWVAELYTPSTVGGLLAGISRMGWEYGRSRSDSLVKWMNDVREGRQAGWMSLGLVAPPGSPHAMPERESLLPVGVHAALPVLMSLTPSVTALVVAFLMDDNTADLLDAPLRADFSTHMAPLFRSRDVIRYVLGNRMIRFGRSIHGPNNIRREQVTASMENLERGCIDWVREHLPGAFAAFADVPFPSAALFVTEKVSPLTEDASKSAAFDAVALDRDYESWESAEWPRARLVLPHSWDGEGARLVFACRRSDAFPEKPRYPDIDSNWTIAERADLLVRGLLSRWALTCLLDVYHEHLSALRDGTARDGGYRPVRDLKQLRSLARTKLYDIVASSQEIEKFSESDDAYRWDVIEMTYTQEVHGKRLDLLSNFQTSQALRAKRVQAESDLLQSTLSTSIDLSQTISSIRIQRLVVLLTFVSTGIAVWALFLALGTPGA